MGRPARAVMVGLLALLVATGLPVVLSGHDALPRIAAAGADEGGMCFYFGNMHAHTGEFSIEAGIPASITYDKAFQYAADEDKGNLDFLAITIHNHEVTPPAYPELLKAVERNDHPGSFVPIAGQEFSTLASGNHLNVYEADVWLNPDDVLNGEFKMLYETWLPKHSTARAFLQFNHPKSSTLHGYQGQEYGLDDYGGSIASLRDATAKWARAIEIVNTEYDYEGEDFPHRDEDYTRLGAFYMAINEGWRIGPTANQDNHRLNYGTAGECRTVAIAPSLTRDEIIRAFLERRFYASEDGDMRVTFRMGEHWMGSEVPVEDVEPLAIRIEDEGEPDATYEVELLSDELGGRRITQNTHPVAEFKLQNNQVAHYTIPEPKPGTYFLLKVTQSATQDDPGEEPTPDDAWTAPIWIVKGDN